MAETVRPRNYYQVASALFEVGNALSKAHADTLNALSGTGEMAGTDDAGNSFADAYDTQAQAFESMGRNLGPAIHKYGRVLLQMGKNHAAAEGDSNTNGSQDGNPPADPGEPPLAMCIAMPTAKGGEGDGLEEVIGLLQKVGIPVPNGNTGKLDTASAAWSKVAADSGGSYKGKLSGVSGMFGDLNGDEIDVVIEDLEELDSFIDEYTELAAALKDSVESHKEYLGQVRSQMDGLLNDMAKDLAVDAVITVGLAVVTAGFGGTVGAAKLTATVTRYGAKIRNVIETVKRTRAGIKVGNFFEKGAKAKSSDRLTHFLQMQLKEANTQGQKNNLRGRIGELKAGIDPNKPKTKIQINGRTRVPDDIDDVAQEVTEVKNTNKIGATQQIKDMMDYAHARGYTMKLVVDERTQISPPLQRLIDSGQITLEKMSLN
ncbi:putative toxin [Gordonia sp. ABSL11-1]|uniref:putative toxin n=1 Tax=Gordonia sp. ABSL11-1 TaxID=3053924 RepID=UPI002574299C|nr:putative toxin [Gordonia sp. ABSL11-1]MDL9944567.1 putative toxin [Gordonia sp. ABSL11-1]